METFDFPYFRVATKYPESTLKFQFGRSWTFAVPPHSPDQRLFVLRMDGLVWYEDENGDPDLLTNPAINLPRLVAFYETHLMWKNFIFPHPMFGERVCKFNKPLEIPVGADGGFAVYNNIELEFIELP